MKNELLREILYISGYIDGDGCFSIKAETSKRHCTIIINSTNRNVLFNFASMFGGVVRCRTSAPSEKQKPIHTYTVGSNEAKKLAEYILPHLIEKKHMCQLFIDYFSAPTTKRKDIFEKLYANRWNENLVEKSHVEVLKTTSKFINATEEDFIYLAGFIDAECHLGIQYYKPKNRPNIVYKIVLQLNNSKFPIFFWLKNRFGGSCHFVERKSKDPNQRNQILWKITGKPAFDICQRIIPYLRYKRPVCEKIIEFYETTLTNGGARHTDYFRKQYASIIVERERIIKEIHTLNHKGPLL